MHRFENVAMNIPKKIHKYMEIIELTKHKYPTNKKMLDGKWRKSLGKFIMCACVCNNLVMKNGISQENEYCIDPQNVTGKVEEKPIGTVKISCMIMIGYLTNIFLYILLG